MGVATATDEGMHKLPTGDGVPPTDVMTDPSEGGYQPATLDLYVCADSESEAIATTGGAPNPPPISVDRDLFGYKKAGAPQGPAPPLLCLADHSGTFGRKAHALTLSAVGWL